MKKLSNTESKLKKALLIKFFFSYDQAGLYVPTFRIIAVSKREEVQCSTQKFPEPRYKKPDPRENSTYEEKMSTHREKLWTPEKKKFNLREKNCNP